jgi:hypothetical protein
MSNSKARQTEYLSERHEGRADRERLDYAPLDHKPLRLVQIANDIGFADVEAHELVGTGLAPGMRAHSFHHGHEQRLEVAQRIENTVKLGPFVLRRRTVHCAPSSRGSRTRR